MSTRFHHFGASFRQASYTTYVLFCPADLSFYSYISYRDEFPCPRNQSRKQHCMQVVQFQHTSSVHTFKCQESCAWVNHTWFFQEFEVEPNNKIFQGKLKHRDIWFEWSTSTYSKFWPPTTVWFERSCGRSKFGNAESDVISQKLVDGIADTICPFSHCQLLQVLVSHGKRSSVRGKLTLGRTYYGPLEIRIPGN